ncbi:MAG TPA: hypothetical protein H9887_03320 [Candidatus Dorea intestinavium]|nr:hypothetical protein [Candidatus Dorea intestinavium]
MNDSQKDHTGRNIGLVLVIMIAFIWLLGSCSNSDSSSSKYDQDLESGYEKYQSGEDMSEDEYNAVKNFNNWREKNTDKSYDEWD